MQTTLQKISEHFKNMLSMSGELCPPDPPFTVHQDCIYIINDANVVEKNQRVVTKIV